MYHQEWLENAYDEIIDLIPMFGRTIVIEPDFDNGLSIEIIVATVNMLFYNDIN